MPHFEKPSQQDFTDRPKTTASCSASSERLQWLRSEHIRFTAGGGRPLDRQARTTMQGETTDDAERQRKGKGLAPAEGEDLLTGGPIGEDGKRVAKQMVLSDKSGLKGGWYWGEPFDFLTEQEQRDYHDAPYEFEDRTAAQNDAVYLYNRAQKYIDTKDWSSHEIDAKI